MYLRKARWQSRNADRCGSIKDINENCLAEFRTHWQCLENHNQQLWNCRSEERKMNKCVFEKLVCWITTLIISPAHNLSENGEDDTRCAQGRHTSPLAHTQHLCYSLSFVYIPPERTTKERINDIYYMCDRDYFRGGPFACYDEAVSSLH
jgi:hypothetical protein